MSWYAHVTVATVVAREGRYLMVHEHTDKGLAYNQPAGHLEENESLQRAALRETLEETGWHVSLTGVLGVHLYKAPANGVTYVRVSFAAEPLTEVANAQLDDGIVAPYWLTYEQLLDLQDELRSPLVMLDIETHRQGKVKPLDMVTSIQVQ